MVILAIDTSAGTSVALVAHNGDVLATHDTLDTMRHAEVVGQAIMNVLADAGVMASEVRLVAGGVGPGPFTGLRVGLAAAVAFATARGIDLHPTVSHDAIAGGWFEQQGSGDLTIGLRVVTDARRKEVYWSDYAGITSGIPVRLAGPAVAKPDDLPPPVGEGSLNTVNAAAVSAIQLALVARAEQGSGITRAFQPLYLRSPDVTLSQGPKRVSS